ncbi:tannase/feruloyl esterase family alpha/beta hydrolase [Sphingomonas sp. RB3P16]|uniref:tannase/feruloyl esterase family alpha/beta hydrolase n=1 Tax=Parasphingomonas frigoris TaxID=3096163 RepID=UPI002FC7EB9B
MATVAQHSLRFLNFPSARPTYDYRTFDWDRDVRDVEAAAATYDAVAPGAAPRLDAFRQRGGRLIAYHGSYDYGVPPAGMIDYYAQVWTRGGGLAATRDWFRLFIVPGMFHCRGGDAPNSFDMLTEIVNWVEHAHAPDGIIATQRDAAGAVQRSRPLYAYPDVARYTGHGDANVAANWARKPLQAGDDRIDWLWKPKS